MSYTISVRNWWKKNPAWPNGLEPDPRARKVTLRRNIATEAEAQAIAQHYNSTHSPGKLSRKAEYTGESN